MTSNLPAWTALDSGALPMPSADPGDGGAVTAIVATAGAVEAGWASGGAVALAHAWATAGRRVVLTDADMLVPTLHAELGLPNQEGLSDVLLWGASVRRVARPVEDGGFYLMSAGTVVADGTEPFEASRWAHLCDGFREAGVVLAVFAPESSVSIGPVLAQASEVVLLAEPSEDLGQLAATIRLPVRGVVGRGEAEAEEPETDAPTPMEAGDGTSDAAVAVEPEVPAAADAGALESPDVPTAESEGNAPDEPLPRGSEASDAIEGGAETEQRGSEGFGEVTDGTEAVDGRDATRLAEPAGPAASRDSADAAITGSDRVRKKAVPPQPRSLRRGRVVVVVVIAVLLGIVAAGLLGFLRIPGIPPLFGASAHSGGQQSSTSVDEPAASLPPASTDATPASPHPAEMPPATTDPAETTPVARFDIAIAAYRDATAAAETASRLRRTVSGVVVTSVPVEVKGTLYYRILVGVAADSKEVAALRARIAKATGLGPASWVTRSTPLAFSFGEVADQATAASRVEDLVGLDLPAYALAVDYSDGSVRYRVYV
ncbi:MAG: SPOR domain-containing protein, partial [Gemmatimonadetes bacterium]|nr:SPOR domain-containing protein [Gemmatimonadota bacterium]